MRTILTTCLLLFGSAPLLAQSEVQEMWKLATGGKVEEAIGLAEAFIEEHPSDPMGYHNLGRFFLMAGEHELAVETLRECLTLEPQQRWALGWTHCALGQSLAALGEKEQAESHLRTAVEMQATENCTAAAREALIQLTGEDPWGKGPLYGRSLPEFEFHGLAGESYRRESFEGTAVLLRFGPSW